MENDAAKIAARLTPAQKQALLWLPPQPDMARDCPRAMGASLRAMAPLSSSRVAGLVWPMFGSGNWYRVTPLGAEVRRLAKWAAPHA